MKSKSGGYWRTRTEPATRWPGAEMPHKDPDAKRRYHREYMRRRRVGCVKPPEPVVKPEAPRYPEQAEPPPRFIDWTRPYSVESRFPYRAWLLQDGFWYHPDTGEFVKPAPQGR